MSVAIASRAGGEHRIAGFVRRDRDDEMGRFRKRRATVSESQLAVEAQRLDAGRAAALEICPRERVVPAIACLGMPAGRAKAVPE